MRRAGFIGCANLLLDPKTCIEFLLPGIAVRYLIAPWATFLASDNNVTARCNCLVRLPHGREPHRLRRRRELHVVSELLVEDFVGFILVHGFGSYPQHICWQAFAWSEHLGARFAEGPFAYWAQAMRFAVLGVCL